MKDKDSYRSRWDDEILEKMDTSSSVDELAIKRDPIEKYLQRKRRLGRAASTIEILERHCREFEEFLYQEFNKHPCEIDDSHIISFNKFLKNGGKYHHLEYRNGESRAIRLSDGTRHDFLVNISSLYRWLSEEENIISTNPVEKALNDFPESEFDLVPPSRPKRTLNEMSNFMDFLKTPAQRTIVLTFLKTGVRLGELINLDMCCLHIDHPLYIHLLKENGIKLVPEIRDKADTIYVEPGYNRGTEIRGEVRKRGNKRKRETGTVIPIDTELKTGLLEYITSRRPPTSHSPEAYPVFVRPSNYGEKDRITQTSIYVMLTSNGSRYGELYDYGWYQPGAPTEENVTIHYFRHYFTHNHRHGQGVHRGSMPEGVIAYIRGDIPEGDTARETNYRHDDWNQWERYVKRPYISNIYQFRTYSHEI